MGPEPMMRMLEMSSRRGTLGPRLLGDVLHELLEEIPGIPRTRTRLGMVLHAPGTQLSAGDALDGTIVEVAVGQLDAVLQSILVHGETVVLARYLYAPRREVPDGMVRAVVPEGHLVRLATEGETQKLVPETDAKRWYFAQQWTQGGHRLAEGGRVAWPVGEEQPVRFGREDVVRARRARHGEDGGAVAPQLSVDGALHTVVQGDDATTFFPEGREHGWFRQLRAGGCEVEADHGRVGGGPLAQDVTV